MATATATQPVDSSPENSAHRSDMPAFRRAPWPWAFSVSLAIVLTGCTEVRTRTLEQGDVTMTQQQFAAHVERVFRYHNKVTSDLIDATGEADLEDEDGALSDAEEKMDEACEPLNEVVSEEAVARESSFWTRRRLPEAVPACEEATQHLEKLMRDLFNSRQKLDVNYGTERNPR